MSRLALLGASGHGKVVAEAAMLSGWDEVVFYDDQWPAIKTVGPWRILGTAGDLLQHVHDSFDAAVVAIGKNATRLAFHQNLAAAGIPTPIIVHPSAVVSGFAQLGAGTVVLANGTINPFAVLGVAGIVNTAASVDHDCVLGDGVHLSPGVRLGGGIVVGDRTWIGAGAVVKNGLSIGRDAIVGAGAAVINDVSDATTVVGVPAKIVNRIES